MNDMQSNPMWGNTHGSQAPRRSKAESHPAHMRSNSVQDLMNDVLAGNAARQQRQQPTLNDNFTAPPPARTPGSRARTASRARNIHAHSTVRGAAASLAHDDRGADENPHARALKILKFAAYFLLGVVFYTQVEEMYWFDALYFIIISVTTVGYGDMSPGTHAGMLFTIVYVGYGIYVVGEAMLAVAEQAAQRMDEAASQAVDDDPTDDVPPTIGGVDTRIVFASGRLLLVTCVGALVYGIGEGVSWATALYYCVVTMTTVGYGDLSPTHWFTKAFAIAFIFVAIACFNMAVDTVGEVQAERETKAKQQRFLESMDKLDIRQIIEMDKEVGGGDGAVDRGEFLVAGLSQMGVLSAQDADAVRVMERFDAMDTSRQGWVAREAIESFLQKEEQLRRQKRASVK